MQQLLLVRQYIVKLVKIANFKTLQVICCQLLFMSIKLQARKGIASTSKKKMQLPAIPRCQIKKALNRFDFSRTQNQSNVTANIFN